MFSFCVHFISATILFKPLKVKLKKGCMFDIATFNAKNVILKKKSFPT